MQKKFESLIKILVSLSFFVPLVVIPTSYIFPFIVPKILLFRSLSLIMLGIYIVLLASNWQKYKIHLTPINITVGLFFISFTISTFVGSDWYRSFWDNHERMLGLFTIFHYTVYYYIISSVLKEWRDWRLVLRIFLLAGSIVMLVGVWQRFVDTEFLLNRGLNRVSATLGNSIYFSGYGLFLMFVGYLLAIKEKKFSFWQWYAIAGSVLGFIGIFLGGTRGTLVGLVVGLGLLVIGYLITLKENKRLRQALFALIILAVIAASLLFVFRQNDFVKSIPAVGKLLNVSLDTGTAHTRMMAWGIAIDGWQEKPVFGWGPNNYYYAFNKYYRPEFLEHGWGETWFDNAHNIVMNTLTVQGGVGIIIYFALFSITIFVLWKKYRQREVDLHLAVVSTAFLGAHFVHNVFVFENPTSYLYFFFFLAFISAQVTTPPEVKGDSKKISWGLTGVMVLLVALLIFSTNINPARANKGALDTVKAIQTRQLDQVINTYQAAIESPSPHIDDIRNDFSRSAMQLISHYNNKKEVDKAKELFDLAYGEVIKNRDLHPLDIRVHIQQVQLAQLGAKVKEDINLVLEAEKVLADAIEKSPKRQQLLYMMASLQWQLRKPQEAVNTMQDSINHNPKVAEGWIRMAGFFKDSGQKDKAEELIKQAVAEGAIFRKTDRNMIKNLFGTTTLIDS